MSAPKNSRIFLGKVTKVIRDFKVVKGFNDLEGLFFYYLVSVRRRIVEMSSR